MNILPLPNRREFLVRAAALGGASFLSANSGASGSSAAAEVPLAPPEKQPEKLKVPEPPARKVGWAIVGLGQLALEELMPAFGESKWARPVALVSGHPEKARKVAATYGVPENALYDYAGFERMRDNAQIEVVYIVLPNTLHAEYTLKALKAGKHVLCEKPMATTVEEGQRMIAAAQQAGRKLGIAYRLFYEPFNRKVMDLCRQQTLGALKSFNGSNCQDVKAPNIRLSGQLGGGPVGDVGVYVLSAARYCTGEDPVEVTAFAHQPKDDPRFREVPESVSFSLRFPSGLVANADCSFGAGESRRFRVHCAKGFIELEGAFGYRGQKLVTSKGSAAEGGQELTEWKLPPVNHFAAEMDHFSECILGREQVRTPGEMGLIDLQVMAAIAEAARTGRAVKVSY